MHTHTFIGSLEGSFCSVFGTGTSVPVSPHALSSPNTAKLTVFSYMYSCFIACSLSIACKHASDHSSITETSSLRQQHKWDPNK